jgi:vacuolar-type H+-ATPase subunit I/STV1
MQATELTELQQEWVRKTVFIIFFHGDRSQFKVKKICESFGANVYQIPENFAERKTFLGQVNARLEDLVNVTKISFQSHSREGGVKKQKASKTSVVGYCEAHSGLA